MAVVFTGVKYFNFFTSCRYEIGMVEATVPPQEVEEVLFHNTGVFDQWDEDNVFCLEKPNMKDDLI